jgi:hypothetical protein
MNRIKNDEVLLTVSTWARHLLTTFTSEHKMAIAASSVRKTKGDVFHAIFEPETGGCSGSCAYKWDSATQRYVLVPGNTCSGAGCHQCAQYKSSSVRELVILERSFPDPDTISYLCGGTTEDSLNALLRLYVDLLKRFKLLVKITIGLGLLSAALLLAVIYLLVR